MAPNCIPITHRISFKISVIVNPIGGGSVPAYPQTWGAPVTTQAKLLLIIFTIKITGIKILSKIFLLLNKMCQVGNDFPALSVSPLNDACQSKHITKIWRFRVWVVRRKTNRGKACMYFRKENSSETILIFFVMIVLSVYNFPDSHNTRYGFGTAHPLCFLLSWYVSRNLCAVFVFITIKI